MDKGGTILKNETTDVCQVFISLYISIFERAKYVKNTSLAQNPLGQ